MFRLVKNTTTAIRPRDTYSPSLIRRMFCRRWCIFFRLLFVSTFLDCSYIYFYIDFITIFYINITIFKSLKFNGPRGEIKPELDWVCIKPELD
jgi:hypothetical protein